jgi:hypothetical protein
MDQRPEMRVSDRDRQAAADRLAMALHEGRLDVVEYDDRLAKAYAAVTYADLDRLFTDLPAPTRAEPVPVAARAVPALPPVTAAQPLALKVLWTIWLAGVIVNLTVWLLVSLSNHEVLYFWPVWLAVPGAALLAVTVGVASMRGGRPAGRQRRRHR